MDSPWKTLLGRTKARATRPAVVERRVAQASADGLPLPGHVLDAVERATRGVRRVACAASMGQEPWGNLGLFTGDCAGPKATESAAVARLRAILEHHGGARSSEHLRVYAQGFLGDDERLEGLRAALREDAGNARARCGLAWGDIRTRVGSTPLR